MLSIPGPYSKKPHGGLRAACSPSLTTFFYKRFVYSKTAEPVSPCGDPFSMPGP